MSKNWPKDIDKMHDKFGVSEVVKEFDAEKLKQFLEFRINFLKEEMTELAESTTPVDTVDALIDLCVVAIGTLDLFGVDSYKAWDVVRKANMKKKVGKNENRENELGLPDLVKPKRWKAPDHSDNVGLFSKVF